MLLDELLDGLVGGVGFGFDGEEELIVGVVLVHEGLEVVIELFVDAFDGDDDGDEGLELCDLGGGECGIEAGTPGEETSSEFMLIAERPAALEQPEYP